MEGTRHLLSLLLKHPTSHQVTQQVHSISLTTGTLYSSIALLNNLLRCYSLSATPHKAFFLYRQVQEPYFTPPLPLNSFSYTFLINCSTNSCDPIVGTQLHGLTTKVGFQRHVYVQTALVNMYCVGEGLVDAVQVFDEMPERNVVTWNAVITGLAKWGWLDFARRLFDEMSERNVVSWTGIIDGYVRMGRYDEGLDLFRRMVSFEGIRPSEISVLAILPAISNDGDVRDCGLVHGYAEKRGFVACDMRVANSILESYAKCGCILSALRFFKEISERKRNLVSWTTIISGLAMHGMEKEAVEYLERMEKVGLEPNEVTFLSILNACSHGGLVEEGLMFFDKMVNEYRLEPSVKHYGCLVDMLGRTGRLEEAEKMALSIPKEIVNDVIWRTLLGACSFHGNVEMGERVTKRIMEIEKAYGGDYAIMYNLFAGVGRFEDAEKLRRLMEKRNAHKVCGRSLV